MWSALAGYEHIWNPKWRTSVFGGYVNVDYNGTATNFILAENPGRIGGLRRPRCWSDHFRQSLCSRVTAAAPTMSFWEAGTRTQWNPVPQLDIGLEVLYSQRNTAFKGAAIVPANLSRPAVFALDDQNVLSAMFRWQRNFYP